MHSRNDSPGVRALMLVAVLVPTLAVETEKLKVQVNIRGAINRILTR
jgi:hypothetical protein